MTKWKIINYINGMVNVIRDNPELFSDGIDEEIIDLFLQIRKYIKENN